MGLLTSRCSVFAFPSRDRERKGSRKRDTSTSRKTEGETTEIKSVAEEDRKTKSRGQNGRWSEKRRLSLKQK